MVMKKLIIYSFFASLLLLGWSAMAAQSSHQDDFKNPSGCGGCHKGRGATGTPLLRHNNEDICFGCHGVFSRGKSKRDIQSVFNKRSIHPVAETTKYHVRGEDLPERTPTAPRHISCYDCHAVHEGTPEIPWAGAPGYAKTRMRLRKASFEYELCYRCHSDSENLPSNQKNKRLEFDPYNESYHPVESSGRNTFVPSLVRGLNVNSKIRCTDCHGNSDSTGARGPHGSDYEPILLAEYRTADGVESAKAYELCYMCHDRRSILGDDSFRKHNLHVANKSVSCHTCHTSHGSVLNKHLIEFNILVVAPTNGYGRPEYLPDQTQPKCYLKCHGTDHQLLGVYRSDGTKTPGSW